MVSQETANQLWFKWMWIFGSSMMIYTIIYRYAFEKQVSNSDHTPENCMKYSSCLLSIINCILCSIAGISIFYHKYWIDPIYGIPGIPFYISATCQSYFIVDLGGDIIIYFWYNLVSFRFDVLIHHCFALSVIPWMTIPIPQYAWFILSIAFSFEFSTIFLNATFFCKWYNKSESVTIKYKIGFLISWFIVRVPGTIGVVVWVIMFRERLYNEYPLEKFIGVILLSIFNAIMQGLWTILIIRKTYRTLTAKDNNQGNAAMDGFDLKRSNSIEVTNVTSEA